MKSGSGQNETVMTSPRICTRCGTVVAGYGPDGLCPKCLLLGGLKVDLQDPPMGKAVSLRLRYFGDYELLEEIAHGGMGVVYKARQTSLNRIVAVKLLLFGRFSTTEFVQRFRAEAAAAARLQHPNIVAIHEVGEHDGQHYFSMDYVEGHDLAELVRERPLPALEAARYLKVIAEAIHYAHEKGILHRDLKPSNILIDEFDQPRITDFGLAKFVIPASGGATGMEPADTGTANDLTITGQVLGSPSYMPPEQAVGRREEMNAGSDIYSLGAILFHLLTGRPPFLAESITETLDQVRYSEPVSPWVLNPSVPRDLETVCLKCLEKEPVRRYATAQELADELKRFLRDEPVHARPVSAATKVGRWCRRNPVVAALAFGLVLALSAGLAISAAQWRRADRNARTAREGVVRLSIANGTRLAEENNPLGALVWFTEGFSKSTGRSPEAEDIHRRRLGWILRRAPKLLQLWAYDEAVNVTRFTPDGRKVVVLTGQSGDPDFSIRSLNVLDVDSGHSLARFIPTNDTGAVNVTDDGSLLATGSGQGTVRIWDVATGARRVQARAHPARILTVRFSPDHRSVLSAAVDGAVQILDAQTGESRGPTLQHGHSVVFAEFSPDGRRIVTASSDARMRVWDAESAAPVSDWIKLGEAPNRIAFSPNSRWIFASDSNRLATLFDAATGKRLVGGILCDGYRPKVAFSGDNSRVAVATRDSFVRIWNTTNGVLAAPPLRHEHVVFSLAFSPDGRWLATGAGDWQARVWDVSSGELVLPPLCHGGLVKDVAFNPDGHRLATASEDGTARVWDLAIDPLLVPVESAVANQPVAVFESKADSAATEEARRMLLERIQGTQPGTPQRNDDLSQVRRSSRALLSPDRKRVATAGTDSTARVWDCETGRPITPALKHDHGIRELAFSPDGRFLLTGTANQHLRIWHSETGEPMTPPLKEPEVRDVRFSVDSRCLVWSMTVKEKLHIVSFAPDERPIGDLNLMAELLGGHRLDGIGGVMPLSGRASREQWETLKVRYPSEFATTPGQIQAWHRRQVEESSSRRQWLAMKFHAERLLANQPEDLRARDRVRFAEGQLIRTGGLIVDPTNLLRLLPERDANAPAASIDLTRFYNGLLVEDVHPSSSGALTGNNLAELPVGIQKFGDVEFDVRGIIKLYGGVFAQRGANYPKAVRSVLIARRLSKIHFLHGTGYGVENGDEIGRFVMRFADGREEVMPIVYGRHVLNWWGQPDPAVLAKDTVVAWKGSNERIRKQNGTIHLYRTTWTNPRPESEISSIDFVSSLTATGPFLIAITVE